MTLPLFVYGTLAPEGPEAAARDGWRPDGVRGRQYDLGPYPALVDVDDPTADWVEGYTLVVPETLLDGPLDDYEGVADGLYRRVEATTRAGVACWVYAYARPVPATTRGPLARWTGRRGALRLDALRARFDFPRTDPT